MEQSEQTKKIIYSLQIMKDLREKGIYPDSAMQNPEYPEYLCWAYSVNDKLVQALDEIFKREAEDRD